jgi:glycosyltransferase involved in cell wall biosynthesis
VPSKLKVAVVAAFPPPPGGMTHQAAMLAEILARDGADVVKINTNPFGRRKPRSLRFLHLLSDLGHLRGADLALIFAGSYASFFAFSAVPLIAARLFKVPTIIMYKGGESRSFFRKWGWLVRPCSRLARAVVVPGRFLAGVFDSFGMRAQVIPDIIDVAVLPERAAPRDGPPLFLCPRRHDYVGGVDLAVRAFGEVVGEFPDAELHLYGDGAERPKLERLAARVAPGQIWFHGVVPHEELVPLLAKATAVVNSTRDDNHPNSVLEAMWVGCPVVATAVGGVPFLVRDGETGYLAEPDDPAALAAQMLRVLRNPAEAAEVAARARGACREFIWPYDRSGKLDALLEIAGVPVRDSAVPNSPAPPRRPA